MRSPWWPRRVPVCFPRFALSPGVTRNGSGGVNGRVSSLSSGSSTGGSGRSGTQYSISGTVSWDLDVWGRVRRQVESSAAAAQVSAADLANAKLSAQATLATDYFDLRAEDAAGQLLTDTVAAYRRALRDHAKPVSCRHVVQYRLRDRAGAIAIDRGATGRRRRAAPAIRACDRRADRARAGRTDHRAGAAGRCRCRCCRPACRRRCWSAVPTSPRRSGRCSRRMR